MIDRPVEQAIKQNVDSSSDAEMDQPHKGHVDSDSDERVVNNVMRHEYRVLSDGEKICMKRFKDMGVDFFLACDNAGQSRELSLAKTKIEEAVMWAVKHITK